MSSSIPNGVHTIKLGASFQSKSDEKKEFHTVRYDFKPASVEDVRESFIEFGENNNVKVYAPKLDESHSITDATLFTGNSKAANKDCVLIYDHQTGAFVLELVSSNINLKKSRDPVSADKVATMKSSLPNLAAKDEATNSAEDAKVEDEFMESEEESDDDDSDDSSSDSSSEEETAPTIKQQPLENRQQPIKQQPPENRQLTFENRQQTFENRQQPIKQQPPETKNLKESPKSKGEKPSTIQLRKDLSLSDSESD